MTTRSPGMSKSMAAYFDHSEVTSRMLRTLGNIGRGGMIIADFYRCEFRATHTRTLNHADHFHLPVFGHGDLIRHLDFLEEEYGTWGEFVAAVDCTAYEGMAERIDDRTATPFAVIRMRQHLQKLGFDMTTAPSCHRRHLDPSDYRDPSVLEVRESYIDRAYPHLEVTLKHPLPEKSERPGFSVIKIADHGRHVSGWPKPILNQFVAGMQAHLIRERVDAHLARTN